MLGLQPNSIFLSDEKNKINCHVCGEENTVVLKIINKILQTNDHIYCKKCKCVIYFEMDIKYKIVNSMEAIANIENYL